MAFGDFDSQNQQSRGLLATTHPLLKGDFSMAVAGHWQRRAPPGISALNLAFEAFKAAQFSGHAMT